MSRQTTWNCLTIFVIGKAMTCRELVRIDPQRGFVEGNVLQVSRRAALFMEFFRAVRAEPPELRRFADLIDDGTFVL